MSAAPEQADDREGQVVAGAQAVDGGGDARRGESRQPDVPWMPVPGRPRFARSTLTPPDTLVAVRIEMKNRNARPRDPAASDR